MRNSIFSWIVCFVFGLVIGYLISNSFNCGGSGKPVIPASSSYTHKTTETREYSEGEERIEVKEKFQEDEFTVHREEITNISGEDNVKYSTIKKEINFDSIGAKLKLEIKAYPPVDSLNVISDLTVKDKYITRIDTIRITRTDSVVISNTEFLSQIPKWIIKTGVRSYFNNETDFFKYINLNYNHDLGFVFIGFEAGLENRLNEGFKRFYPAGKIEMSIPLW